MDKGIEYVLNRADLDNHAESFKQLGVTKVKHFVDVYDANLEKDIGLTEIEIRRLKRVFGEVQSETSKEDSCTEGNLNRSMRS